MLRSGVVLVMLAWMFGCSASQDSGPGLEGDYTSSDGTFDQTSDASQGCEVVACDGEGVCGTTLWLEEGEACGDTACGVSLTCQGGVCLPETPLCDDENPCTDDVCGGDGQCEHTPRTGGELHCGEGECAGIAVECLAGELQICTPKEPGAEVCDGKDNDCNGVVDDGIPQLTCGVGACAGTAPGCVDGEVPDCTANAAATTNETCNGIDDDCNGTVDDAGTPGCEPYLLDEDGDGYSPSSTQYQCLCAPLAPYTALTSGDCDDELFEVHPGANEVCNGHDDDCNGGSDEPGSTGCIPYYVDVDEDSFGDSSQSECLCAGDEQHPVSVGEDCNDGDSAIHPEGEELCNGKDDDCDGETDEENATGCIKRYLDEDGDGWGVASETDFHCICSGQPNIEKYTSSYSGDCCDLDYRVHPQQSTYAVTISLCNSWDFNCDGFPTKQYPDGGTCHMELVTCNVSQFGFANGIPDCGGVGAYLIDCSYDWGVCAKTTESRTQGCR